MTILASEALASATSPLTEAAAHLAVATEQQEHAETLLQELLALLPMEPSFSAVNKFADGFEGRFGAELVMALVVEDLTGIQSLIGGCLLIEACTSMDGMPFLRHSLTGTRAGVPFSVWTTVYPFLGSVAA